jgi:hypothetical protein
MDTLTYISRSDRYNQRTAANRKANVRIYPPEERTNRFRIFLPFLILVYIFNGSHDPKKVHCVNCALSAIFFAAALLIDPDFLLIGIMFFAVALANIVIVWILQNFGRGAWSPAQTEILSQLHLSVQQYTKR